MTSPNPHDGERDETRGYEVRDVETPSILAAALALTVMIALFCAVAWGVYRHLAAREAGSSPPANPLAATRTRQQPPTPRLQANPLRDLEEFRAQESQWLASYGWIDRAQGVIRIPIDRAVALLVERGLPTRTAAPAADDGAR